MSNKEEQEKVNPIRFTDDGTNYVLDFNRDSALFAQNRGVPLSEIQDKATIVIQELFYASFRKNHRKMSKGQTDALLDKYGGLKPSQVGHLLSLYQQASYAGVMREEEDEGKNAGMTMEWD